MMVEVKPIDAIVYDLEKVDIENVIAPPYDVISDEYRDELIDRSEYNFVKLILNKGSENLDDENNRYNQAFDCYEKWLNDGILVKTEKPSIFYIIQNYVTDKGQKVSRKGFIAKNKVEEFSEGNIMPHEFTMGGPKEDRLKLMSKLNANLSQVFLVYSDKTKAIEKCIDFSQKPFIDVTDDKGVQNIVYKIDDEKVIKTIEETLKDKKMLIADGHHRYETALGYSKISDSENAKYVMSYFTNLEDENLLIFPTHRILEKLIEPFSLLETVKKYYDVTPFVFNSTNKEEVKETFLKELNEASLTGIAMGLYIKSVNIFYLLKLSDFDKVSKILDECGVSKELQSLDLTILHKIILTKELEFTEEEQASQTNIKYIKQEQEAFDRIDEGTAEASFIMASPKIEDIFKISEAGYRMPQKSTYFYPKLLSGIVINPL